MNKRIVVGLIGLLFLVVVLGTMLATAWTGGYVHPTDSKDFSSLIFNEYGVAVLMVGFVLFVSMLGGVFLAQEEKE
jgi:NADH:ubiquinone oxidoreductase subunit 6 (subunit J)